MLPCVTACLARALLCVCLCGLFRWARCCCLFLTLRYRLIVVYMSYRGSDTGSVYHIVDPRGSSRDELFQNNVATRTKCAGHHQHYGTDNHILNNIYYHVDIGDDRHCTASHFFAGPVARRACHLPPGWSQLAQSLTTCAAGAGDVPVPGRKEILMDGKCDGSIRFERTRHLLHTQCQCRKLLLRFWEER